MKILFKAIAEPFVFAIKLILIFLTIVALYGSIPVVMWLAVMTLIPKLWGIPVVGTLLWVVLCGFIISETDSQRFINAAKMFLNGANK